MTAGGATAEPLTADGPADATLVLRLQHDVGNAAVTAAIGRRAAHPEATRRAVQRRVDPTSPPVPPSKHAPTRDPAFAAVTKQVRTVGAKLTAHPSPRKEVGEARDAAEPPSNDADAQAKAAKVDDMGRAKPGTFDKAKFVEAVRAAIASSSPKTLEEADEHKTSGKTEQVKTQVMGQVSAGKDSSTAAIKTATAAAPDPGAARPKPVTPMAPPTSAPASAVPGAAAMPAPAPPEQLNLQGGKHETDAEMSDAGVTEQQLSTSNEPQFQDALGAKRAGEEHAATAPAAVRAAEASTLGEAKAGASGSTTGALASMVAAKAGGTAKVGDSKSAAKAKEESERAQVAAKIEGIFAATKTDTEAILKGIDPQVEATFTRGEAAARAAFEQHHTSRMQAWKDKRYAGLNWTQWLVDKIAGPPPEVQTFFTQARELYVSKMEGVISEVADVIGRELTRARDRIAQGRAEVKQFVASQPANLRKYAAESEETVSTQFEQLDQSVDDKQESLVEDLASKYNEAKAAVDARVEELQADSKGLWDAAKAAVGEAIETIKKLKAMVEAVFARVASAVERIIKDPITFIGNFVGAVKAGLNRFVDNIGTHLTKGIRGWLFGALADAGIEIPDTFDFKGILKLVLSIIGATWQALRAMIVKRIGEPVMAKIERTVGFVKMLVEQGPIALWKSFMAKLGDIRGMVMEQIKSFLITKVIVAGVTWLISMLNPAAAFAKAVKAIVDVVNFFVEKGEAIKGVIDSAVDSVEEILAGGVGKVASMIENALAKVVPVLIGLLASLLGLGGLGEKIQKILETLRKPVNKAMDWVVGKVVKVGKGLLRKLKNSKLGKAAAKAKAKVKAGIAKGKAYVKKKVAGAKAWATKKMDKLLGRDDSPAGRDKRMKAALASVVAAVGQVQGASDAESSPRPEDALLANASRADDARPAAQWADMACRRDDPAHEC